MSSLRFLLLEDSPLDAELIQASLAEGGIEYELVRVDTRDAYLMALEQNGFDLILADYSLPTFDGVSALGVAQSMYPNLPFIFVSAVLGEEVAIEMLKSGATDYVLKQRLSRLVPSVRRALQEAEERSKRQAAEAALRQQSIRSQILAEVSHALSENLLDFQSVLNTIAQRCAELVGDSCVIRFLSEDGQWLKLAAIYHRNPEFRQFIQVAMDAKQPASAGYHAQVLQTGKAVMVSELELNQLQAALQPDLPSFLDRFPVSSLLIVPLSAQGRTIGTVGMLREQPNHPFTPEEQDLLQSLADRAALSIENARLYQESQNANRVKDQFLAVLSHELRSPLNPILGWTKLLRTRQLDEATTQRALSIIERNAKIQTQLIDDLLDVSRILRGKLNLTVRSVNLAETIEAAFETVRLAATTKTIQIRPDLDRDIQVSGDAGRLQQIFWNLLSNAVKFTPEGGQVMVTLKRLPLKQSANHRLEHTQTISTLAPEKPATDPSTYPSSWLPQMAESVQIIVRDTGKGINPELLPHVFDYFWQADSSTTRSFGGLGLGLAIVRHLVELHGGTVWAESAGEGQGATFVVQLPLLKDEAQRMTDEKLQSSFLNSQSSILKGIRVLAVDDEADMRELTKFILMQAGAEVTVVTSADEALLSLSQTKPDILVTDVGMPTVDGYMLLRQIRTLTQAEGGTIPAIALTAYAGEVNRQQALAAGFQRHLTKPIDPEVLIETIAVLVKSGSTQPN